MPGLAEGVHYKYRIRHGNEVHEKSDPYGFQQEVRPKTASIVADIDSYQWYDWDWMEKRRHTEPLTEAISVYEVHLGSWMHGSASEPAIGPDGKPIPPVIVADLKPGARFQT